MKVYLNEINGLWAAIDAMYFSKRTWTREREIHLKNLYAEHFDRWGMKVKEPNEEMRNLMSMLFKWSKSHITLGRFLDFTFTVEGLHRGGQDDFDSHAKRLENRILRSSTRLSDYENEKSEWYEDKILTLDEVIDLLNLDLPDVLNTDEGEFVRATNGYIRKDLQNDRDVKRGLYMLSIPSTFIFKSNCTEFAHIVNERDSSSHAHPEVRNMIERCKADIEYNIPLLTTEYYRSVKN